MFVDAEALPDTAVLKTDICIVGGGAAGITLARELIGSGIRVALLESGGTALEAETQELYAGRSVGRRPYMSLTECRLRFFGGTTNHWGGWCSPLDLIDFEAREGIPYSGWPFGRAALDPYYARAHEVCELGPYDYTPEHWGISPRELCAPFDGPLFCTRILQLSPPTRFGPAYEAALRRAQEVTVFLHANVRQFYTNDEGSLVLQLVAETLGRKRFAVKANHFVLAAGGIENARLLLLSGAAEEPGRGLGNAHDLVGRTFMTHLEYTAGLLQILDPKARFDFDTGDGELYGGFGGMHGYLSFIALTEAAMRVQALPNIKLRWTYRVPIAEADIAAPPIHQAEALGPAIHAIYHDFKGEPDAVDRKVFLRDRLPLDALLLRMTSEPLPNPDSRITLSGERDALGQPRVEVDWNVTAEDKRNAIRTLHLLGAEAGRVGLGRLQSYLTYNDFVWPADFFGDQHHMGTTRMHKDPAQGVVNEDCRLHGVGNLYVAGSSVFPTAGAANPTLTIVALALRLADHLKGRFT